jgi:L-histidine N-alpha-methyltransferase
MNHQFLKDVIEGLSKAPQKTLPSKYFYDATGDAIFVKIMAMPEYYLTNAEMDIFKNKTNELIEALAISKGQYYELIEFGPGDGTKSIHLLSALTEQGYDFEYLPVDISANALQGLEKMLHSKLPALKINAKQGDYFVALEQLRHNTRPKVVMVLGSNIGNLSDNKAARFIYQLGANLVKDDKIILGVDLIKAKEIVLPAYSDEQGITAAFNLNLLDRINKELDGNFDRNQFEHFADYDEGEGIAKSFLRSKVKHEINVANHRFSFEKGETIQTEISRKYNDQIIKNILSETDITCEHKIMDSKGFFADYILMKH